MIRWLSHFASKSNLSHNLWALNSTQFLFASRSKIIRASKPKSSKKKKKTKKTSEASNLSLTEHQSDRLAKESFKNQFSRPSVINQMNKKGESVEETYKKVSPVQHIILRPDTYIGSTQVVDESMWVFDEESKKFKFSRINYIPGLYKIFDEILVNAADNYQRDSKMSRLDVHIDEKSGMISVLNDGKSIPVQIHREHKIYVAELIFGHLLTSSNYEDKKKKVTGGRNGYGAKLANIFSNYFAIETADSASRKILKIEWKKNMSIMSNPQTLVYQGKDYTKVTFVPDFEKFNIRGFTPEIISLFKKRVYDLAGIMKCSVSLNGEKIKINKFEDYTKLYMNEGENEEVISDPDENSKRWQVIIAKSEGQFQQVSFVNGIATFNGGTHVSHICDQIVEKLLPILNKKVKDITIKPFQIKCNLRIFINCLIQNPSFSSQTKDSLTTACNKFGSQYLVSDKIIKSMMKNGTVDRILNQVRSKENTKIDKNLKKFKNHIHRLVIPKLEDANNAGRTNDCTLILTEGDSAKALAMSGIEQLGRDNYGVFPLRGKVINVREMTNKQVMQNFELSSIVKILGLHFNKPYTNTQDLRYGSVMIMADQDNDGSHIKGLVLNFFYTFWPSLCEIPGFLKEFVTPIIRCRRGNERVDFFCQGDFQLWKINQTTEWKVKYYKGLGTSTSSQAKQYFSNLMKHQIKFKFQDQNDKGCFDLAFNKKKTDERKRWLEDFDRTQNVNYNIKQLKIEDFFNKQFRHFSIADNVRSIPSIVDGLKPSQRKILYSCFKRNLKNQIKVAQLAGYVSEHSAYHHGEMSLCSTIISMSQNYVGSNNLNLLEPIGQFGTRHLNGKDHASARYIFTCLNSLTRYLFNEADDHIVDYMQEENMSIQPQYYYPILPLVLINGADGIGTGWSTSIHPHRVSDVIKLVRERIQGEYKFISIGWENFSGTIQLLQKGVFSVKGAYEVEGESVTIKQIPVGRSVRDYKTFLQQKVKSLQNQDPEIEDIREYHTGDQVQFVITFIDGKMPHEADLQKYLKLETKIQQSNMIMFNPDAKIKKYDSIADIIEQFYQTRLKAYTKRKEYLQSKYMRESEILEAKISFINAVMMGKFKMMEKKDSWIRQLAADRYKRFNELTKIKSTKINDTDSNDDSNKDYNYLLSIPIWNFCQQKIVELEIALEQAQKMLKFYENVEETEMWLKDLEQFEQAWKAYESGKQVQNYQKKQIQNKKKELARQNVENALDKNNRKDKEAPKKRNATKKNKKSIMEQQIEKDPELAGFQSGRKIVKNDSSRYDPIKIPSPKKEEDKIDTLLSKYLKPSKDDQKAEVVRGSAGLSFAERIKARIQRKDEHFENTYKEAMNEDENLSNDNNDDKNKNNNGKDKDNNKADESNKKMKETQKQQEKKKKKKNLIEDEGEENDEGQYSLEDFQSSKEKKGKKKDDEDLDLDWLQ